MGYVSRRKTTFHNKNKFRSPGRAFLWHWRGGKPPKTVLRAGYGIFYNRFTYDLLLNTNRYSLDQPGSGADDPVQPQWNPAGSAHGRVLRRYPTFYRVQPSLNAPAT